MQKLLFLLLLAALQSATAQPVDTGYYQSFDHTKIYYESVGGGTPVVLVHGFIVNSQSWKKTALYADLVNKGYRVIIMDLRGNGRSDKPQDSTAYDNDAEAKDIMGLLSKLQVHHYYAVGYSRGSIITARLLVLDKRVKAAVMGGMGTDFTNPEWPRRIMFYHALRGDDIPEMKPVIDNITRQGLDRMALAWMQRSQPSTSQALLKKIKQPVLVICGEQDSDNGSAENLSKLFRHSVFKTVPGDHGGAYHTPAFAEAVIQFLSMQ